MKLYKSLLVMSALAGVALTSCNDDGYWNEYKKSDLANGVTYSFNTSADNLVYEFDENIEGNEYSVVITRSDTKEDETLDLAVVASDPDAFEADESVFFEAGQSEATYTVKLAREWELEETQSINVAIDFSKFGFEMPKAPEEPEIEEPAEPGEDATEEEKAAYEAAKKEYDKVMAEYEAKVAEYEAALNTISKQSGDYKISYTLTVKKDGAWEDLGNATFTDDWTFSKSGYPVKLQRSLSDPSMYRLVQPYYTASTDLSQDNIVFYVLKAGETLYGVDLTQDGLVYFDMFTAGEKYDDASTIYALHPGMFSSRRSEDQFTGSYVKEWQDDGTPGLVVLSPYWYVFDDETGEGMGGWSSYIFSELIQIQFPGYVKKNYSTEVTYNGLYTDLSSVQYVLGTATFGPDVVSAKAVLANGKNKINDAYANLLADVNVTDLTVEDGEFQIPMIVSAPTDDYTLAIFTFDENGEMQDYGYTSFSYVGLGGEETWTSLGTGVYTYTLLYTDNDGNPIQDEYELFQSDLKPNRFKIANWAASDPDEGTSYDFIFHQDWEGNIIVDECETGSELGTYGMISVMDPNDYWGDSWPYGEGYYDSETKTYHFMVVYFVEEGTMDGWYGEETFQVGASLEAKAFKAPAKIKASNKEKFIKAQENKPRLFERKNTPYVFETMDRFMRPFRR